MISVKKLIIKALSPLFFKKKEKILKIFCFGGPINLPGFTKRLEKEISIELPELNGVIIHSASHFSFFIWKIQCRYVDKFLSTAEFSADIVQR